MYIDGKNVKSLRIMYTYLKVENGMKRIWHSTCVYGTYEHLYSLCFENDAKKKLFSLENHLKEKLFLFKGKFERSKKTPV